MKSDRIWMLVTCGAIIIAFGGWCRGPVEIERIVPRIRTVHDTVLQLDTAWVERVREVLRVDTINLTEVVTLTVPETVTVVPRIACATSLDVPPAWGDSMMVGGLRIEPGDSSYILTKWQAQYFSTGPLRSMLVDSIPPRVSFWPPPPQPERGCGFFCSLKKYTLGGIGGYGLCRLGVLAR